MQSSSVSPGSNRNNRATRKTREPETFGKTKKNTNPMETPEPKEPRTDEILDIDNLDDEELTVDNDFFDESEDDIDNYYNNLYKKKK